MNPKPDEITGLLRAWHDGSEEALDQLWPVVYGELKQLARGILGARGRAGREQPTSLLHKAYLRLLSTDLEWNDRRHFFAVAARAMRFVLVDEARRQLSLKRGDGKILTLDDSRAPIIVAEPRQTQHPEEVLAVHQALERLAKTRPRLEKLVELRYFSGLSVEESAEVLNVTPRTLARDWKSVRTWLRAQLETPS